MPKKSKGVSSNARTRGGGPNPIAVRAPKKAPLTDAERHRRFLDMAREVQASERAQDFDEAFKLVTSKEAKDSR